METNNYAPIWDALRLGHQKPVVGARFVSPETSEYTAYLESAKPTGAKKPEKILCVYYSAYNSAYYVIIKRNGKRYRLAFFDTVEDAIVARDELWKRLDSAP